MRYCAAAETGYEELSGKPSTRFIPTRDADGNVVPPEAITIDYIYLAVSAIVAAYAANDEEPPVSVKQILYDTSPFEVGELIKSVGELRSFWYDVPTVMQEESKESNANP